MGYTPIINADLDSNINKFIKSSIHSSSYTFINSIHKYFGFIKVKGTIADLNITYEDDRYHYNFTMVDVTITGFMVYLIYGILPIFDFKRQVFVNETFGFTLGYNERFIKKIIIENYVDCLIVFWGEEDYQALQK